MIPDKAWLAENIFEKDRESRPIREGFGEGIILAGENDPNVVLLTADLTDSTYSGDFAKKYPNRFYNVGVAEQNMVAIAAGLGVSGKIPFTTSYAAFCPGRTWEQIRTTVAYNDSNVKIAGHHAGISVGADGATHQAMEDIATMRVMANMKVIVPCDAIEAKKATVAAARIWGPVYLRYARESVPVITTKKTPFVPGKAEIFWESDRPKVVIFACGIMVYKSIFAARELEKHKTESLVINVHTVKPLDNRKILEAVKKAGAVVVAEEHMKAGGLGGAVAELLSAECPAPIEFVGMGDVFGESGAANELMDKYGMDVKDIVTAARKAIKRRKTR